MSKFVKNEEDKKQRKQRGANIQEKRRMLKKQRISKMAKDEAVKIRRKQEEQKG